MELACQHSHNLGCEVFTCSFHNLYISQIISDLFHLSREHLPQNQLSFAMW